MKIVDLLKRESVELNGKVTSKPEAIEKMVALMAAGGNLADVEAYKKGVFAREEESTTGIGEGIAIPHAKTAAVKAPGLAAMVVKDGVDYDSLDGEPAKLIFLIAAPDTEDNVHLEVLSRLSMLLMDPDFRTGLMEAEKTRRKTLVSNIKQSIEANRDCGVLYLDTVTPDGFGSPKMKIIVKYAGEEAESELYFGSVKPEAVTFDLGGTATVRFAMKNKPVEYVILESFGEDSIFVSNVRLLFGGVKYSVCGVQKTGGKVINEQNITKCDTTFAELGESSGIKHLDDVSLAKIPNGVKLYFDKIV